MMSEIMNSLIDYLNQEQKTAKDVIILAVASSFVFWLMTVLFKPLENLILKLIKKLITNSKEFSRKYIKQRMSVGEYLRLQERINSGGEIKWYEKKSYYKFKKQEKEAAEKWQGEFNNVSKEVLNMGNLLNYYKDEIKKK